MRVRLIILALWCIFNVGQSVNIDDTLDSYRPYESFVELKGGQFHMGINDRFGVNGEHPQRNAIVNPFRIHLYPVTVASFKSYKKEKYKHRTDAEKRHSSWVFAPLINSKAELEDPSFVGDDDDTKESRIYSMKRVVDSRWNKPEGGDSLITERLLHPVVHVSYNDAFAYCAWKNMRLPTEIEWEFAARGGHKDKLYPWGDYWEVGRTNLWQGRFPDENQMRDNHYGLAPVDAYKPQNAYEMYDLIGNTWEWTSSVYRTFRNRSEVNEHIQKRVLKGGSFLDNRDGEYRSDKMKIRISSRTGRSLDYSAQNVGFRCAQSIRPEEKVKFNSEGFNVVKIRAPIKHNLPKSKKPKIEL